MRLTVFREERRIGSLDILANEPFLGFTYDVDYVTSSNNNAISLSLPVVESRYSGAQARPFFEGLLPEGEARDAIARRLGISRSSPVKLLKVLGRDCAGDLTIIDENEDPCAYPVFDVDRETQMQYLLDVDIHGIAKKPREEIPRLQEEIRLSLAGGQEKIALYHDSDCNIQEGWYIPSRSLPSTHIIKPGLLENHYPNVTLNEFLCLRTATECGLAAVDVDLLYPDTPILIIRRYDRLIDDMIINGLKTVKRIHQEDCCQASGVNSDMKYEHDGGPGFKSIRDLFAKYSKQPIKDIASLVRWGVFNYLIGNCDAHAKNLSILHNMDGTVSLAPVYDLISSAIYDGRFGSKLSSNMGMKIGMHENLDRINAEDFNLFAKDVNVRLRQIKSINDELIQRLPSAFNKACLAAEAKGFSAAGEIAERILYGCNKRAVNLV